MMKTCTKNNCVEKGDGTGLRKYLYSHRDLLLICYERKQGAKIGIKRLAVQCHLGSQQWVKMDSHQDWALWHFHGLAEAGDNTERKPL